MCLLSFWYCLAILLHLPTSYLEQNKLSQSNRTIYIKDIELKYLVEIGTVIVIEISVNILFKNILLYSTTQASDS